MINKSNRGTKIKPLTAFLICFSAISYGGNIDSLDEAGIKASFNTAFNNSLKGDSSYASNLTHPKIRRIQNGKFGLSKTIIPIIENRDAHDSNLLALHIGTIESIPTSNRGNYILVSLILEKDGEAKKFRKKSYYIGARSNGSWKFFSGEIVEIAPTILYESFPNFPRAFKLPPSGQGHEYKGEVVKEIGKLIDLNVLDGLQYPPIDSLNSPEAFFRLVSRLESILHLPTSYIRIMQMMPAPQDQYFTIINLDSGMFARVYYERGVPYYVDSGSAEYYLNAIMKQSIESYVQYRIEPYLTGAAGKDDLYSPAIIMKLCTYKLLTKFDPSLSKFSFSALRKEIVLSQNHHMQELGYSSEEIKERTAVTADACGIDSGNIGLFYDETTEK